jgi:hypothetical protein
VEEHASAMAESKVSLREPRRRRRGASRGCSGFSRRHHSARVKESERGADAPVLLYVREEEGE